MTKQLVILATTYPRWKDDAKNPFVKDFAYTVASEFNSVVVIVPHYVGAKKKEIHGNITTRRFRYMWPAKHQNIVYEKHAGELASFRPFYALKLMLFLFSQFVTTLVCTKRDSTINAHWLVPQGMTAIVVGKIKRAKVVITIHGGDVFTLNSKIMRIIKKFILRHADEVVVNSTVTREVAQEIYDGREYHVIPMGTDVDLFKPNRSGVKNGTQLKVAFTGRLDVQKGVSYVLEAMDILVNTQKNTKVFLKIAGSGPIEDELRDFVKEKGLADYVEFLGWVNHRQVRELLSGSDVFVGPSIINDSGWREAFGLSFTEAMACGLPVITTKTGGMVDFIEHNKNGIFVPQKDAKAIADALALFAENRKALDVMSKNCRQKIVKEYSWKAIKKKYLPVLES